MADSDHQEPTYVLGHSDRELDRLTAQARLLNPITMRFVRESGIVSGMRVLDVGTGTGDVALVAAEVVGADGEIIGVDRDAAALARARSRATAAELPNVSFREGDASDMVFEQPFDAIIGRYVVLFQEDPVRMLRTLVPHLKPGAVVVFHEPGLLDGRLIPTSFPASPTWDRCSHWVVETFRQSGADMKGAFKLHSAFLAAGLPPPTMRAEAIVRGGAESRDVVAWLVGIVDTLLPSMERFGIASATDVGLETLAQRLIDEIVANASVVMRHFEVGVWCRR